MIVRRDIHGLDDADEGKYMTDEEILDKYINLEDSCLDGKEENKL